MLLAPVTADAHTLSENIVIGVPLKEPTKERAAGGDADAIAAAIKACSIAAATSVVEGIEGQQADTNPHDVLELMDQNPPTAAVFNEHMAWTKPHGAGLVTHAHAIKEYTEYLARSGLSPEMRGWYKAALLKRKQTAARSAAKPAPTKDAHRRAQQLAGTLASALQQYCHHHIPHALQHADGSYHLVSVRASHFDQHDPWSREALGPHHANTRLVACVLKHATTTTTDDHDGTRARLSHPADLYFLWDGKRDNIHAKAIRAEPPSCSTTLVPHDRAGPCSKEPSPTRDYPALDVDEDVVHATHVAKPRRLHRTDDNAIVTPHDNVISELLGHSAWVTLYQGEPGGHENRIGPPLEVGEPFIHVEIFPRDGEPTRTGFPLANAARGTQQLRRDGILKPTDVLATTRLDGRMQKVSGNQHECCTFIQALNAWVNLEDGTPLKDIRFDAYTVVGADRFGDNCKLINLPHRACCDDHAALNLDDPKDRRIAYSAIVEHPYLPPYKKEEQLDFMDELTMNQLHTKGWARNDTYYLAFTEAGNVYLCCNISMYKHGTAPLTLCTRRARLTFMAKDNRAQRATNIAEWQEQHVGFYRSNNLASHGMPYLIFNASQNTAPFDYVDANNMLVLTANNISVARITADRNRVPRLKINGSKVVAIKYAFKGYNIADPAKPRPPMLPDPHSPHTFKALDCTKGEGMREKTYGKAYEHPSYGGADPVVRTTERICAPHQLSHPLHDSRDVAMRQATAARRAAEASKKRPGSPPGTRVQLHSLQPPQDHFNGKIATVKKVKFNNNKPPAAATTTVQVGDGTKLHRVKVQEANIKHLSTHDVLAHAKAAQEDAEALHGTHYISPPKHHFLPGERDEYKRMKMPAADVTNRRNVGQRTANVHVTYHDTRTGDLKYLQVPLRILDANKPITVRKNLAKKIGVTLADLANCTLLEECDNPEGNGDVDDYGEEPVEIDSKLKAGVAYRLVYDLVGTHGPLHARGPPTPAPRRKRAAPDKKAAQLHAPADGTGAGDEKKQPAAKKLKVINNVIDLSYLTSNHAPPHTNTTSAPHTDPQTAHEPQRASTAGLAPPPKACTITTPDNHTQNSQLWEDTRHQQGATIIQRCINQMSIMPRTIQLDAPMAAGKSTAIDWLATQTKRPGTWHPATTITKKENLGAFQKELMLPKDTPNKPLLVQQAVLKARHTIPADCALAILERGPASSLAFLLADRTRGVISETQFTECVNMVAKIGWLPKAHIFIVETVDTCMLRVKHRGQPGDNHITRAYMIHVHKAHATLASILHEYAKRTQQISVWHVHNDEHNQAGATPHWCNAIDDCIRHLTNTATKANTPPPAATQQQAHPPAPPPTHKPDAGTTNDKRGKPQVATEESNPRHQEPKRFKTIRFLVTSPQHTRMTISIIATPHDSANTIMTHIAAAALSHYNTRIPADPCQHVCTHHNGLKANTVIELSGNLLDSNSGQTYDLKRKGVPAPTNAALAPPPEPQGDTLDEPLTRLHTAKTVKMVNIHLTDQNVTTGTHLELATKLAITSSDSTTKFHQRLVRAVKKAKNWTLKEATQYEAIDSKHNKLAKLDGSLLNDESGTTYYIRPAKTPLSPASRAQQTWEQSQNHHRGVPDEQAQQTADDNSEAKMAVDIKDLGKSALSMPANELLAKLKGSDLNNELANSALLNTTGPTPLHPAILRPCVTVDRTQLLLPEYFAHAKTAIDILLEPGKQEYALQQDGSIMPKEDQLPPIRSQLQFTRACDSLDIYATATHRQTHGESLQHRSYLRKLDNMASQYELDAIKSYDRAFRALKHHKEIASWDTERMDLTIKFLLPGLRKARNEPQHRTKTNRKNTHRQNETTNRPRAKTSVRGAGRDTELCRQFQAGKCTRGSACRFKHTRNTMSTNAAKASTKTGQK